MQNIRYQDLPESLVLLVKPEDFLRGVARPDKGTIVIWLNDKVLRRQKESEFDLKQSRFLSIAERKATMPDSGETLSRDGKWTAQVGYSFDDATGICYETFSTTKAGAPSEPITARQMYFKPARLDPHDFVEGAVAEAEFPAKYAQWSRAEKVSYWVGILYRLRRTAGEDGFDQDGVFDEKLIADMRRLDPTVETILPDILIMLASMEGTQAADMFGVFSRRTGYPLASNAEPQPGNRKPGKPKRKGRPLLWTMLALVAAFSAAMVLNRSFREEVWLLSGVIYNEITKPNDPVTRALRERHVQTWGERVDLVPQPFSKGQARAEVEAVLGKAKYRLDPDRQLSFRHDYDLSPDSVVYEMTASEGPCNIRYGVAVRFDSSGRLAEASGARDEAGCL